MVYRDWYQLPAKYEDLFSIQSSLSLVRFGLKDNHQWLPSKNLKSFMLKKFGKRWELNCLELIDAIWFGVCMLFLSMHSLCGWQSKIAFPLVIECWNGVWMVMGTVCSVIAELKVETTCSLNVVLARGYGGMFWISVVILLSLLSWDEVVREGLMGRKGRSLHSVLL